MTETGKQPPTFKLSGKTKSVGLAEMPLSQVRAPFHGVAVMREGAVQPGVFRDPPSIQVRLHDGSRQWNVCQRQADEGKKWGLSSSPRQ